MHNVLADVTFEESHRKQFLKDFRFFCKHVQILFLKTYSGEIGAPDSWPSCFSFSLMVRFSLFDEILHAPVKVCGSLNWVSCWKNYCPKHHFIFYWTSLSSSSLSSFFSSSPSSSTSFLSIFSTVFGSNSESYCLGNHFENYLSSGLETPIFVSR